jgi:hypothetical protein
MSPVPPPPPRRRSLRLLVGTIGGAVVATVVVLVGVAVAINITFGSSLSATASTTSTTVELHRVGEAETTSGLEVRVLGFRDPQPPTAANPAAPAGQHLVSVDLRVRNPGPNAFTFTPLFTCILTDAQHDPIGLPGFDPAHFELSDLKETDLAPGGHAEQSVVFVVPNGATGLVFTVHGSITANGSAYALR